VNLSVLSYPMFSLSVFYRSVINFYWDLGFLCCVNHAQFSVFCVLVVLAFLSLLGKLLARKKGCTRGEGAGGLAPSG